MAYQIPFGHYRGTTKPPLAITKPLPAPLWTLPSHYRAPLATTKHSFSHYQALFSYYQAITKLPLAPAKRLPSPWSPLPSNFQAPFSYYQATTKPPLATTKPLPIPFEPLPSLFGHYQAPYQTPRWQLPSHRCQLPSNYQAPYGQNHKSTKPSLATTMHF